MVIKAEIAQSIVYEEHEDWESITTPKTVGNDRWSVKKEQIFKHIPTGKYYKFNWNEGATEMQDEKPYQYDKEVKIYEVEQREVTELQWKVVESIKTIN